MFYINEDYSIYVTRGDIAYFSVSADNNGESYKFQPGDVVRIKVYGKKDCENIVLQKDFPITVESQTVEIFLTEEDTKIGGVISKQKDYWYEIELNPENNPQTIIGYDDNGSKIFRLFPEGGDLTENDPIITPADIPIVDSELDLTSKRPVENRAVARAVERIKADIPIVDSELDLTSKRPVENRAVAKEVESINDKINAFKKILYPVGSVWVGGKNAEGVVIDPATILGGTWELFDKEFSVGYVEETIKNTEFDGETILSSLNIRSVRGGHSIRLRLSFTIAKDFNENSSSSKLADIDFYKHGLIPLDMGYIEEFFPNGFLNTVTIGNKGEILGVNLYSSSGADKYPENAKTGLYYRCGTAETKSQFYVEFSIKPIVGQMNNNFCGKFYWRKTADVTEGV